MLKNSKNQLNKLILMETFTEIFRKDVRFDKVKSHTIPGLYPLFRSHIFGKTTAVGSILIEYLDIHAKNVHNKKC